MTLLLAGSAWADQIVLKDGDRITGAIIKKDGEKLTVESKNFGVITLKWADVETIASENPLNVVLSGYTRERHGVKADLLYSGLLAKRRQGAVVRLRSLRLRQTPPYPSPNPKNS